MADWNLLSNHGRVLFCVAKNPDVRLRDLADQLGLTERTAYGIVSDLAKSGVVTKKREGRRNRYVVHSDLTFDELLNRHVTIGAALALFDPQNSFGTHATGGRSR